MQADTKNYDANIAKAKRSLDQFKRDNLSLGGVLKQSTAQLTAMAAQFMSVYAAVNAAKKVLGDMVSINMQFEQSSANLAAVMGTTRDQTAALTAQAKQLGATTQYTAVQITELQTNLARLGFTESEILNSTKAVQALATATGAGLGDAANLAGAALRGFGMNAAEMERVASVLAVSTTKSALSFEKLAAAVPIVAPVAKQFGMTIEDTVTLLGKLSDAGFDASTAATSTRNIFLKMADSSGKLAQALGRPIKNVDDLGEALTELKNRGIDLAEMLDLTDKRSVAAFATFIDNASTLKDFKASITDCADALQGMVDEQLNTLQGSVTIMKSAWEGLMLTFSNSNGILKQTTDAMTRLLQAWTNWNNRRNGGDEAISSFEKGFNKAGADATVKGYRAGGMSDADIYVKIEAETKPLEEARDKAKALYDQLKSIETAGEQIAWNDAFRKMFPNYNLKTDGAAPGYLMRYIAGQNDLINRGQYMMGLVTPATVDEDNPKNPFGGTEAEKAAERAAKAVASAREAYALAIERATTRFETGLDTEEQFKAKELAAHEQLYEALSKAYNVYADPEVKSAIDDEKNKIKALSLSLKQLKDAYDKRKEDEQKEAQKLRQQQSNDRSILRGLNSAAARGGWTSEQLGTAGFAARIEIEDIPDSEWQALADNLNEHLQSLGLKPIHIDFETSTVQQVGSDVKGLKTDWTQAAQAVAQFGSALQSVEDPTAKLAGIIAEAIASVAAGAGGAIAKMGQEGEAWSWIAFAISATATMVSTIAAIKNATKFEHGGMVGGNSFSGDNIVARLNSGEGVLTAKGVENAANLAASFGRGGATPNTTPYATGETIVLGVNNYFGRTGQGEIVTTAMLRRAGINIG